MTQQIQQGFSGFEKFTSIMDIKPSITNLPVAIPLENPKGKIEFRNVSFSYQEDNEEGESVQHVLNNFNLVIEPGKKVAIIGETGVGKSTISRLIPRFYEVNQGEILIDDVPIKQYELSSLRRAIGHVQQDVFIFYGTIKDNILYGKPDATDEEVIEAAKRANIHDFIASLEEGYETITGERGVKLSGGQKQRIAIARLFLKKPQIVILDEATSSLDNATERFIQASFDELTKDKTSIIIAHRLSTIRHCDEIIVLGREGIIERGNHDELIAKQGVYYQLLLDQ
jgi:ATP-binding cassette subfamily B protein